MKLTRRDAIKVSGTAVAGLSMGVVKPDRVLAQEAQEFPDQLVEGEIRTRADLPLNADGSAPEHPPGSAGPIDGVIYRYTGGEAPDIDLDYRTASIRIAASRLSRLHGTLRHEDLADLPRHSMVTLLQCGAPRPTGIAKWTGVRFNDVLDSFSSTSLGRFSAPVQAPQELPTLVPVPSFIEKLRLQLNPHRHLTPAPLEARPGRRFATLRTEQIRTFDQIRALLEGMHSRSRSCNGVGND